MSKSELKRLAIQRAAAQSRAEGANSNEGLEGTCKKCGGAMKPGKAIEQTWVGTPERTGEWRGVTMSPGGSGKLIDCAKCEKCGWSMTSNV